MKMKRLAVLLLALALIVGLEVALTHGLGGGESASAPAATASPEPTAEPAATPEPTPPIDLEKTKPNEAGEIPIVMFHAFVEETEPDESASTSFKQYTQSFAYFKDLLGRLYDMGYRMTSMNDFLSNSIAVEAGYKPVIFTFDDSSASQFSLIEENGELVVNPQCAVAVMLDFYKEHPDFGLEGTFYVNLGASPFYEERTEGTPLAGTAQERLQYLIDLGFEVGNHTYSHYSLPDARDAETVMYEVGKNQAVMYDLVKDYTFTSFSLPFGSTTPDLFEYVKGGVYEGVAYKNLGIVEVGWDPAISPVNPDYNPYSIHRIRGTGFLAEDCDFEWWLKNPRDPIYVSDGDPDIVTVPESYLSLVDQSKLGTKQLRTY